MIPNAEPVELVSSGVQESVDFGISEEDMPRIMGILRNTLYTRKIDAILREYGTNAWDAHQEAGKGNRPIKVTLPTVMNPVLSIRDFGLGLSPEAVLRVYTQYGKSTKRDSNKTAGMLGIGSKSGFCYSESFTVISWHGGWKRIYVAALDPSNRGKMSLLDETELPPEQAGETGVEIQIPAKRQDLYEFEVRAKEVYSYFEPMPEINTQMPERTYRVALDHGYVDTTNRDNRWVAVMGCVSYHINLDVIQEELLTADLYRSLTCIAGGLRFEMGEIEISANREDLEYTDRTKAALVARFLLLVQEYVAHTVAILEGTRHSDWEKRLEVVALTSKFHVDLPPGARLYAKASVPLFEEGENPKSFVLIDSDNTQTNKVYVSKDTSLYLRDDRRSLSGYHLSGLAVVVRPTAGANLEVVRADLEKCIQDAKLTGIPIKKLSEMNWQHSPGSRNPNEKHKVNSFEFDPGGVHNSFDTPYSDHWEISNKEPTEDDVFVIISGFQAVGKHDFYYSYRIDRALVTSLGGVMPPIRGYKTTEKRPVQETDCQGKPYWQWRKEYIRNLATPEMTTRLDHWRWSKALEERRSWETLPRTVGDVVAELGVQHPASKVFLRWKEAQAGPLLRDFNGDRNREMLELDMILAPTEPNPEKEVRAILDRYPLLQTAKDGLNTLRSSSGKHWTQYILLMDDAKDCSGTTAVA